MLLLAVTGAGTGDRVRQHRQPPAGAGAGRSAEMAVRAVDRRGRGQLVRQLLAESGILALAGGALGLLVARWTLDLILSLMPSDAANLVNFAIDSASCSSPWRQRRHGTAVRLVPRPSQHPPEPGDRHQGTGRAAVGSRAASRFRTTLVTTQMALSMLLLICAGLFVKSLFNVSRVDLGLSTEHVVTFAVSPALNGYTGPRSLELFERLEDELAALPGVEGVSAAIVPVLAGDNWGSNLEVEGFQAGPDTDTNASFNEIGPGYFRTMGVALLAGREFTRADGGTSAPVAIVNEQFTKKFNLGRQAVGKHIQDGRKDSPQIEIVGVVANAKYSEVKDAPPPQYFLPYRQGRTLGFLNFYVRSALPPDQLLATIPKVVARIDPNLPVQDLRTMEQQVRENVFLDRLLTVLSASFALLATLLAAVGLYGVLAFTVAQRTREIGLRMALGAAPGRVRRMILSQMGVMTAIGGGVGLGLAVLAGRSAESLLFELKGHDPLVFAVVGGAPRSDRDGRRPRARAPRLEGGSDDGAQIRIAGRGPRLPQLAAVHGVTPVRCRPRCP